LDGQTNLFVDGREEDLKEVKNFVRRRCCLQTKNSVGEKQTQIGAIRASASLFSEEEEAAAHRDGD